MSNLPILFAALILGGLLATLACASPSLTPTQSPSSIGSTRPAPLVAPDRDGSPVYPSIEGAVEAAFASARRGEWPRERDRLRIGTIRRVEGGFTFVAPAVSASAVSAMRPMQVRLRLGPEDVAVYGIHPRSGHADFDRANEMVSRHERRLVDQQDPLHRPIYVLTPSRRVIRYPEANESIELVRRENEGSSRR